MLESSERAAAGLEALGLACERGGKPLFAGVDARVPAGTALLLLGPNGSGKSTLLRALAGLHEPVGGTVRWQGRPVKLRSAEWRTRLAYAGHKSGHKDDLSVAENLALACALEGADAAAERTAALERAGLARRRVLPVKRLSQGQKQRLTLARLSLSRRPLWLLDEPAAALDADARALLGEILRAHLQRGGVALVATHDAIELADRAVPELRLG
jgi:heme exporter protein A